MIGVYIKAMGGWPTFLLLASWFVCAEACRVGATVWLSHWTGVADMPGVRALATCPAWCITRIEFKMWKGKNMLT